MRTVEQDVDRRARESLIIGGAVVNEFMAGRGEQLRASVEVLAADFGLREAVASGDEATIQSVLSNHSKRVGADVALLLDLDGKGVASSSGIALGTRSDYLRLIEDVRKKSSAQSTATFAGKTYHTFTVPVRAPVAIAWVVLGFQIDSDLAERIRGLTGLEVSIVSTSDNEQPLVTTTIHTGNEADTSLAGTSTPLDTIYMVDEAGLASLTLSTQFVNTGKDILVVLQRSLQEAMEPYAKARRGLLVFAAVLLVFVAVVAAWFSGTVASPLRALTVAARRMISGNYDVKIAVRTNDEFGELASSFNAMRTAIAERETRISHQALHDPLTDLPNRAKVMQMLTVAIEHARSVNAEVTVLSIKLSRINEISSTLGHSASDEVIALAAKHLRVNLDP